MTTVVHASGRFTATAANLETALDAYATDADIITLTEVGQRKFWHTLRSWARRNGWHLWHPTFRGGSECAILSRRRMTARKTWRLTRLTLRAGRTAPLYLVAAHIDGGPWVGVWHTPAHNGGLSRALWPTRVYRTALTGLRAARMRMHGGGVVLCADWNLDLRRQEIRAQLARPYPRMRWGWTSGQKNTQGGRVIDGVLTNLPILEPSVTLPAQPGFDHKAVLTKLGRKKEKK